MHEDPFFEVLMRVEGGVLEQVRRLVYNIRPRWHSQAACRGVGVDVFFLEHGASDYSDARALCARCPVAAECAEAGRDERSGLWGGTTPRQRLAQRHTAA